MFRPLTRIRQVLPEAECIRLLTEEKRGVLSVAGDDGYPYGMPMNHYYDPADGLIYFHCGRSGHRLDAVRRCEKASFCVYDQGYRREGEWALNIASVIVFGRLEVVDDPARVREQTRKLSLKFIRDEAYIGEEIRRSSPATLLLVLHPEHISGKMVNES